MKKITLHKSLIDTLCAHGWNCMGFKKNLRKRLQMMPWYDPNDETIEALEDLHVLPDCWRIKIERWNWHILIIEAMEVCVTYDISTEKLINYNNFWWAMDSTERIHFRLFRMNRDKTTSIVLDKRPLEFICNHEHFHEGATGAFVCDDCGETAGA